MEPNDTSKETSFDMVELVNGLNEMRDALVSLSMFVKDLKSTVDWERKGEGMQEAMAVLAQAASRLEGSGTRPQAPD
jgi:hypothetical protein